MISRSNSSLLSLCKSISEKSGLAIFIVGCLVFVGWIFDIQFLKSLHPSFVTMKANTALSFILIGTSLWLLQTKRSNKRIVLIAQVCAGAVASIGLLTIGEYLFGYDLGIDQILFTESSRAIGTSAPGRMGFNTAFNFLVLGLSLMLLGLETGSRHRPAQFLALMGASVSLVAFIGYLYSNQSLIGLAGYTQMALHTALAFIVICIGILCARPDSGLMTMVTSEGSGGILARRLILPAIGIPLFIGWLRLIGQRAGLYGTEFGLSLTAASSIIIFIMLIWWNARLIDRIDTERKALKEERDLFFDLSLDMQCVAGFDGYFKQLNPEWEKALGWKTEELLAKPYLEFVHPEDRSPTSTEAQRLSFGKAVITFENRYICKDGSYKWLQWNSFPSVERQLIYAGARDVTERKRSEEAVRQSELFLMSIVENIPDMIFVKDANELKFVRFNKAGEELIGYSRDELIGKNDYDFFPKDEAEFFTTKDRLVLKERKLLDIPEEPLNTKNRGVRILHTKKIPILDKEGMPQYLLGISEDITERKKAEEQIQALNAELERQVTNLKTANKELDAFSFSVSHDLRAPLRSIDGFSQALLEDYMDKLNDQGKDFLVRIRAATTRMTQLIDDMLSLSRVTRSELHLEKVDLSALVNSIASDLRKIQPERKVEFVIAPGLITHGDARLLRIALENLLGNAWKFTGRRPEAKIEFGAVEQQGKPAYFVRDNGAGFDMAYAEKLFGVFQRLHGMTEFPGTGIGLATVQRIIHRHGGDVWAEGKVEQGATLYFTLSPQ